MRQQVENDEKREQLQYSQSLKNTYTSSVIDMPPAPTQKSDVPPQILQVSIVVPQHLSNNLWIILLLKANV